MAAAVPGIAVHCKNSAVANLGIGMVERMESRYIGNLIGGRNRDMSILPYRKHRIFPICKGIPGKMIRAIADTFYYRSTTIRKIRGFYSNRQIVTNCHIGRSPILLVSRIKINAGVADTFCVFIINSLDLNMKIITKGRICQYIPYTAYNGAFCFLTSICNSYRNSTVIANGQITF
ncbi:hypothetical protein [uncultured Acidaminococcus sp.]|uniref:hypothetical protein n=1 Tax=uncultured Acidaminococcus sp. TaxID=352152 RepID=UPI00258BEF70|nr:hypothetical protein [uncultured Acidaminococcus sp.]